MLSSWVNPLPIGVGVTTLRHLAPFQCIVSFTNMACALVSPEVQQLVLDVHDRLSSSLQYCMPLFGLKTGALDHFLPSQCSTSLTSSTSGPKMPSAPTAQQFVAELQRTARMALM